MGSGQSLNNGSEIAGRAAENREVDGLGPSAAPARLPAMYGNRSK